MDSNINIILNAYDKGLKAGISQAKKEFKDFSSSVNSAVTESNKALSSLGSTISTVISAIALYKIGDFLKDTALASSRFAEMGIAMNVVGENAGYSAQQLAYVDEQMRKTGISMIESRTAVTKLAQAHMDLSLATKFADAAQGAAVIGQMSSSEALDRMITGIQASEVEVLRHIGINVSWEKSYAKVAEQTGRAKESFTEQEKVMIRSNAVLEAATITNNLYLKSMENAGKQLRTLTGRELPDFKVAMGKAFDPAMTDLIAAARTALAEMRIEITKPDVQRALSDLSKSLTKTIIQIGTDIPSAISKLADSIKTVTDIYNSMPAGVVGAAGAGVVGTILFGPQTGAVIGLITLTSSKINQFKKDHPEIFGVEDKKEWFAGPFKIPTQEPANLKSSLPPEKVVPDLKSASSVLSSELDKMKSANQTVLLLLEDAYKKGSISLEKYFADRLAIINQEYDKEAAVLQEIAANDKTPDAKAKTNAKLFELEQAHTRDIVKLNQQKAKDIADYEDALSKSAIDRNKAVTETELEALKNQYDQQIITIDQYVASRTAILNKTFELDKQAISNQLAVEDEIKKRMGLEDQLYILEQKHKKDILDINNELLESEKKTALERSQAIASMYQAMGESSQASYDAQIEILNEQANRYKQLKIDQLVIDKWYQDQVYSIQKQQALTSNDMSDWHFCKKLAIANSRRFYIKYNPLIKKTEFHWEEDKVQDSVVVFKYNAGDATTLFNFKPDMSTQGLPTMIEIVYIDRTVPKAQAWKVTAKLSKTKGVVVGKPQIVKSGTWVDKNVPSGSEFKVQVMGEDKALFGLPMTIKNTMDVTTLAKAFFAKYQDWFIVASCKTVGIETLHKYQVHKFTGVTSRYDGAYKVYKVKHNYSNDAGYTLEMELNKLITKFDDLATPEALI